MDADLLQHLEKVLDVENLTTQRLSGGDIHNAFLLRSNDHQYFVKYSTHASARDMFVKESMGLARLAVSDSVYIPKVFGHGSHRSHAYLLLEYLPPSAPSPTFWRHFGHQLAALHRTEGVGFGLEHDNYIGLLNQSNQKHQDWHEFYAQERILPQVQLARDRGYITKELVKRSEELCKQAENICPLESPALLHGDLWSGNFICTFGDRPVLIDPACYYGHREMDLAMTMLFGGFSQEFYQSYQEHYPIVPGFEARVNFYQLYYLLVHLNIFGQSYYHQVRHIIETYSK